MGYYNRFVIMVVFSFLFPLVIYPIKSVGAISSSDGKNDFSVIINQHYVALGETWDDLRMKQLGGQISEGFVGDMPYGDTSYKFYQHAYKILKYIRLTYSGIESTEMLMVISLRKSHSMTIKLKQHEALRLVTKKSM